MEPLSAEARDRRGGNRLGHLGINGSQCGLGTTSEKKMRGTEVKGGQAEHSYISYINDYPVLSACCVPNTVRPSPT